VDPGFGLPTPVPAPAAVRGAIRARVLAETLGRATAGAEPPRLAGRYRLVREIGKGGMGVVWEAELEPLRKRVAIKLLRRAALAAPGPAARLLREAIAVSAIGHEHIVKVDDFGTDERGEPFLVMELLQGRSLAAELVEVGPLPWPRVATILLQLCDALALAHRHGIVHRDLKPANIFLVARDDGADYCKLLDFGLCKPLDGSVPAVVETHAGAMLGTPAYMPPEQIEGGRVDGRADLYALGCVAYEMLTGKLAFAAGRADECFEAHLRGVSPGFAGALPCPSAAMAIIERALARDRDARFADADEMARAIRSITGVRPRGPARARQRGSARRPLVLATAVMTALSCGAALGTMTSAPPLQRASAVLRVPSIVAPLAAAKATAVPIVSPVPTAAPTPIVDAPTGEPLPQPPVRDRAKPRRTTTPPVTAEARPESTPPPRSAADTRLIDGIRDPFAR
jgi:serine/threonine-protein kinase